jgi:methylaspartate mutase S subunit
MRAKTLVTGVIGSDTHIVGNRILSMALEKAGYKVVALGALTPAAEFVRAAVETDADAILVSSLYGQGELDCRGFRDLCVEAGLEDILIYVGGNLVVGKQTWEEVEQRVTKPLEKLIWELPGVEYIYSTSSPGQVLTVVRFLVGWNEERAIVQLNQKLSANFDIIPRGASPPLVKPRRIDDVPILGLTLHGSGYDASDLRRIAAAVNDEVKQVRDVSETTLIGGLRRHRHARKRQRAPGSDPGGCKTSRDQCHRGG